MAEYTPFQQSFSGNLEIEDYKRHLTMPDDPCSTCYYYPDYYTNCSFCSAVGKPTIELTGFEFDDMAFTGPSKNFGNTVFAGRNNYNMSVFPFVKVSEENGKKYPTASTLIECPTFVNDFGAYTGTIPWPVYERAGSPYYWSDCAGQTVISDPTLARAAWGEYVGVNDCSACSGCMRLPVTYIAEPQVTYNVSVTAAYNLHYATSYRPGCYGAEGSGQNHDSWCDGDQWTQAFTLPPGLLVYILAVSNDNNCFDKRAYLPTIHQHWCFRVYHMDLTTNPKIVETRPLTNYYKTRTAYRLNCNATGELNLIYESDNQYMYINVDQNAGGWRPDQSGFNPSCIGSYKRSARWGNWNGGDGKVTVNTNTAVVIPARPKAGASASASGTASVG